MIDYKFDRSDGVLRCSCGWAFLIDDTYLEGGAFRKHLEEHLFGDNKEVSDGLE